VAVARQSRGMRQIATAQPDDLQREPENRPAGLTEQELLARVTSPRARCAGPGVDPDDWFPASTRSGSARAEAARALALCAECAVRAECLELSLRQWDTAGRDGVWGGLLAMERAAVRGRWLAGASVTSLLSVRVSDGVEVS
jgi:hypothetical protein